MMEGCFFDFAYIRDELVETHREELEDDTAIFHGNHLMPAFFQSELLP